MKEHPELERRVLTMPVPEFPIWQKFDVDFEKRIEEVTGMRLLKENFFKHSKGYIIYFFITLFIITISSLFLAF